MAEVHVTFPARQNKQAFVQLDPKSAIQNEDVTWHFHCENTNVKGAKITFDVVSGNKRPDYFPTEVPGSQHKFKQDSFKNSGYSIWGRAPKYYPPDHAPTWQEDKYTIIRIDANGKPMKETECDPRIRTNGP